jgi:glutaredoxin
VAHLRRAEDVDALRRVRARRPARGGSDRDARDLPVAAVTVFHAEGCHLCERALEQLHRLRDELGFALQEVDIGGDPELEARYREWLPVVEIDGERAFVYWLDEAAFRRRLASA